MTIRDTAQFTWTSGCNLSLSYKVSDVSCKGGNNGGIDLSVGDGKSPFLYAWSNGASTEDITGLTAGSYSVTVTDANKCSQTIAVKVAEPATALTASSTAGTISCYGGTTMVTVDAMGGTAPYTGTGEFTASAGDYSYTVKDANGCTTTSTGTVTQPASAVSCSIAVSPNPTVSGGDLNTIYIGNGPQSVTLTGAGTGGTGEYNYDWGSDGTGSAITVSPTVTTTYTLTVTDANKCTSTCQVTINVVKAENPCDKNPVRCHIRVLPGFTLPGQKEYTIYKGYGLQNALLYADVDGGKCPYTYKWSGGSKFLFDPVRFVSPNITTTYTLYVTDAKGCTSTCSVTIKVVDVRCGNRGDKVKLCYGNHEVCANKWEVPFALWCGAKLGDCGWKKSEKRIAGNIDEMKITNSITPFIKAYPNPANKYLNVEWNAGDNDRSVLRVIDMQGRVLITRQFKGLLKTGINNTRLELNGLCKRDVYIAVNR